MISIKNRPLTYSDVIGQESAKLILKNIRLTESYDRSYQFSAPHGTGKTTLARIFARSILCRNVGPDGSPCNECKSCLMHIKDVHPSYTEVDAASNTGKEDMEAIKEKLSYENPDGVTIFLLDECHRISSSGKDSLLKTLEAGGNDVHYIFLFCTTESRKMPRTIWSRSLPIPTRAPTPSMISARLEHLCKLEGIPYELEAIKEIAHSCEGHVRDAEQALRVASLLGGATLSNVRDTSTLDTALIAKGLGALGRNLKEALDSFDAVIQASGPEQAYAGILQMLVGAMMVGLDPAKRESGTLAAEIWKKLSKKTPTLIDYIVSRQVLGVPSLFRADVVVMHTRIMLGEIKDSGNHQFGQEATVKPQVTTHVAHKDPTAVSDDPWILSESVRQHKAEQRKKAASAGGDSQSKTSKGIYQPVETTNAPPNQLKRS